jgi:hypothetical protein
LKAFFSDGQANTIEVPLSQSWYQGLGSGFGGTNRAVCGGIILHQIERGVYFPTPSHQKFWKKTPIASIDISLIGRNLWLSTDYKGVDPETSLNRF